jgi:ABC-type dipeptide/oligopeptide/nickel transport system permease subunit
MVSSPLAWFFRAVVRRCAPTGEGSGDYALMSNFSGNVLSEDTALITEVPASQTTVAGRSLRQLAWRRLKKDKVAMTGGVVVLLLLLTAIFAPLINKLLGIDPYEFNTKLLDPANSFPRGQGGISSGHWLGIEPASGRDILARLIVGARISLTIAILATCLSVAIGVVLGTLAGFSGGWVDTVISRAMDVMLAFPVLLFSIAILVILGSVDHIWFINGSGVRISLLVFIIGFFSWAYIGRVMRGQVLSLREKEFVDASRSLGARNSRIIVKELLPNLVAPILVYATLTIPTNILTEAGLSFLGVGIQEPDPSWGKMLSTAQATVQIDPTYMLFPGIAIFITVLAFNLFGDGLRDALDPKSNR